MPKESIDDYNFKIKIFISNLGKNLNLFSQNPSLAIKGLTAGVWTWQETIPSFFNIIDGLVFLVNQLSLESIVMKFISSNSLTCSLNFPALVFLQFLKILVYFFTPFLMQARIT